MAAAEEPPNLTSAERRSVERLAILGESRGEALVAQPMMVIDVGHGGVKVETTFPFQLASIHELRIPIADRTIVARGRVTHCSVIEVGAESVRYRSGFEFVDLPERTRLAIDAFVNDVKGQRRGATSS